MKRTWLLLIALLTSIVMVTQAVPPLLAEDFRVMELPVVTVQVDGTTLNATAYVVNGRTLVPLRAIFTALSASVEWDEATQTVTARKANRTVKLTIDHTEAWVNDQPTTLSVPATLINGSTFVPLRFVGEALGIPTEQIKFDGATSTVSIFTGSDLPTIAQVHEGTINPNGETWLAGILHTVKGTFKVEGKDSPVLVINAGAMVQFEEGASIEVGSGAPGGLKIDGTASNPVQLVSTSAGARPGSWRGIRFFNQTLRGNATIKNARISYAGNTGDYSGAIYAEGYDKLVEVLVTDTEITNSQFAGINLWGQARLAAGSKNLTITGTKSVEGKGGFPFITTVFGSNSLPTGKYSDNDFNAVNLWTSGSDYKITDNTTWKNIGIPYASSQTIFVEGDANPTLTIEPGVVTFWKPGTSLRVGFSKPGTLVADAKFEGVDKKAALNAGLNLATSNRMKPLPSALMPENKAIVFATWDNTGNRGGWDGVQFYSLAGDKNKMIGTVVAYAGKDQEYSAGIYLEDNLNKPVRLQLADSLITGALKAGLQAFGSNASLMPGSTGNTFTQNGVGLRLFPQAIASLESGNTITGNDSDVISIWASISQKVTQQGTWRNHGVPYYFEVTAEIEGANEPVITIEPGTKLMFAKNQGIYVGYKDVGSLVAKGTQDKPITFTAKLQRPGAWKGLIFSTNAGNDNKLENVIIEYATYGMEVEPDLGAFIKNSIIRNCSEAGVWRYYKPGTNLESNNTFEGNTLNQH